MNTRRTWIDARKRRYVTFRSGALALAVFVCALPALAGCAVHTGGDALAFLRGGALWTVLGDGSQARELVSGGVASFGWSPDHHQIVFRTVAASNVSGGLAPTQAPADAPGNIDIVSINGGFPLQLSPGDPGLARSDAWWDANGNRLLYRELYLTAPDTPTYIVSQSDQPAGIARKLVLDAASVPAISADGKQVAVIDAAGNVRVGAPGSEGTARASGAALTLPQTGRPAHVLWQPHTDAVLYPVAAGNATTLMLVSSSGKPRAIGTFAGLLDAAFSRDGQRLLVRTTQDFELWPVSGAASATFTWPESDPFALPWWSPDGRMLVVQDASGLQLVSPAARTVRTLLTYGQTATGGTGLDRHGWHPTSASPWSPDGTQVVLVADAGSTWLGKPVPPAKTGTTGLYVASVHGGTMGAATLVDSGADIMPSWSALDPSTTFLAGS
ncbi:MAG TPA: hypothetical protein VGS80_14055 [Ktedonobacterales bacterium]|nr:hypothetical protein [Ktedonobacterales bacterium]